MDVPRSPTPSRVPSPLPTVRADPAEWPPLMSGDVCRPEMFAGGTGTPVGPARLGCGVFAMGSQVRGGSEGPPPLPAPWTPSFCPNFFKLMFFYCRALKIPSIDSPVCPRQTQRGHNRRKEGPSPVRPHTPLCPFPNLPLSVNRSAPPTPAAHTHTQVLRWVDRRPQEDMARL